MESAHVMVVLIVTIVMIAGVLRARYGYRHRRRHGKHESETIYGPPAETRHLEAELTRLKQRVAVLERIATDKNHLLEQEIESLRDPGHRSRSEHRA